MLRIRNHTVEMNVEHSMNRRSFVLSLAVAPFVAALVGCGDSNQQSSPSVPTSPPTPPGTTPGTVPGTTPVSVPPGIDHPNGPDEVVLRLSYEGGLVAPGYVFAAMPQLLVSGDGRAFTQGVVPAIYPGPLLPNVLVRTIGESGIQAMLGVVNAAGLVAPPPDYTVTTQVADAPNTVLTINAAGGTFVHSAYALGIDVAETPVRQKLLDAITSLTSLDATVGSVGPDAAFVATSYRLRARAVYPAELANQDLPPMVVDWPGAAGVALRDAGDCARVDAAAVGTLFIDAKQNTYFREDDDVMYQVSLRGVLPGDPAC